MHRQYLALLSVLLFIETAAAVGSKPVGEPHVYKKINDTELTLYVTKPMEWAATDTRPAIVFFHGGGWVGGAPGQFTEHSKYFATRGIVCFQVQYRLLDKTEKVPPITCTHDAKTAMRWIRARAEQFGIDPNRIASAGGSAGGHLAAFVGCVDGGADPTDAETLAKVSEKSNAMLLFNPVYDNGPDDGWGTGRIKDRVQEFSPAHNLTKDDPPSVVFLGSEDKLIPVAVAERFRTNCEAVKVKSELHVYEGQGHGFFNFGKDDGKWYHQTVTASDKFLASLGWIEGPPTLGNSKTAEE